MIVIKNIHKTFATSDLTVNAVDNVSLKIEDGEIYGVIGYSGAGKSTLVRCINFLEVPDSGSIEISGFGTISAESQNLYYIHDGKKVKAGDSQLRALRRQIGMIFQHFNLLDRFLVLMEKRNVPVILCFTKADLATAEFKKEVQTIYEPAGYPVCFTDYHDFEGEGHKKLFHLLSGKVTAFAGPSGVGKSTLVNHFCPEAGMDTGEVSEKIKRGKHTTRHSEIFYLGNQTFLFDTPGFSSLDVLSLEKEELELLFPEFSPYLGQCRFTGCSHISEPSCGIKEAVQNGKISQKRYESYTAFYKELNAVRRYK